MSKREKLQKRKASASNNLIRMEVTNDENWRTLASDEKDKEAVVSYSTNREKVYHKNTGTIEEIHVLESSGRTTRDFAEEHWSSEIKSYVMPQPPKFIQVIKAFRVLATDTLTFVVEVQSDPPAIFEWFCNDRPVQQNQRKFKARHGINITTLTVEGPEQGVYKCTARNPVGISTTYGYVTVNAPPLHNTWLEQMHQIKEEMNVEIIDKENISKSEISTDKPPRFIQQVPNLTLRPGNEALIDVEVEASPPAKFIWYVNGVRFRDAVGQFEVYYPMANRCIARFPIPQKGEYKVIAENRAGKEHSVGYIDVKNGEAPFSEDKGRASSVCRMVDCYEESSYYQRSTSLPRQIDHPYDMSTVRNFEDNVNDLQQQQQQQQRQKEQQYQEREYLTSVEFIEVENEQLHAAKRRRYSETAQHLLPEKPVFTYELPTDVVVGPEEDLVLSVYFKSVPAVDVKWSVNGFELKNSKKVKIISDDEHSTLVCLPPIRCGNYSVTVANKYGTSTQTAHVHYGEGKQYEGVKESRLLSNEITEHPGSAYTTTKLFDRWELVNEQQRLSKSADSFETDKYEERATEGRETSTAYQSSNFTHTMRQNEESSGGGRGTVSYVTATNPPQPLPKPMTPVIHEPLVGQSVSVTPEAPHSSCYVEKRYEEVMSGVLKSIYEPSEPVEPMLHKSLTEQSYGEVVRAGSEVTIHTVPSAKQQQQNEITEHQVFDNKTFNIPVQRVVERIPKHPCILKQPEPEIRLKAGEKLVLESKVDSSPASQFKWYQNNFEVRPSPSVIIESPAVNESRATFLKPISGTYKMVASNIHGSCSSTTRVVTEVTEEWTAESSVSIIRALPEKREPNYQLRKRSCTVTRNDLPKAPRIIERFAPLLKISNNEKLVLRVTADAIPEAEFRWMLNNFEVRTSQSVCIEELGPNVSQITFHSPISGRYEVVARNSLGQDSCSAKVIIDYAEEAQIIPIKPAERPTVPKVPVFIKPLPGETQLYAEEKEFRLSVLVDGEKPITFRWFADGSLLSNSVEHQMINDLESSTLVVRKQIGCDVDYAVEVSNVHGAVWSETTVRPPLLTLATSGTLPATSPAEICDAQRCSPHYNVVLVDKNLQQNDEFTAHVAISAESSPCEFIWTLNGRDVHTIPGFHVRSTFYDSTLCVKSVLSKHSGELSVMACNKYGTARSSAKITVHPSREEVYKFISETETITERVLREGREIVETEIAAEKEDETKVIHPATQRPRFSKVMVDQYERNIVVSCKVLSEAPVAVSWYKGGERLHHTDKYRLKKLYDDTYTLTIYNVDKWDEGQYVCRAENAYDSSERVIYVQPLVKSREIGDEALIEENDSEVVGLQDNIGYVEKKYTDTTVKVLVEPEVSSSQEVYSHTAELRKTEVEYKLLVKVAEIVASNLVARVVLDEAIHTAVRRMNVEVQSSEEEEFESVCEQYPCPPRFETNIECYTVDIGDAVVLHTDISGYPQPHVAWYFGQQKLEQSDQVEVKCVNKQAILKIKKVEKKHEGTYYCCAENKHGKAVLPCNLYVTSSADLGWSESTHKTTQAPLAYTLSETEAEVSSNVYVSHAEETYDHYFTSIQPETFALGYSCRASTSRVHDDSLIITRESMHKMIEKEHEVTGVNFNVNVVRTSPVFKHDARILRSASERVTTSGLKSQYATAEEEIETNNILLIGDQRVLRQHQVVINVVATVVFEKPPQRALHEVTCLRDEKEHVSKGKIHAVGAVELQRIEAVNELLSTIMATQGQFLEAHAGVYVDVRRPDSMFDHFITVIESEHECLEMHLFASVAVRNLVTSDLHLQQKPNSLHTESVYTEYAKRNATAHQRIVILQSSLQEFSEAIVWNLKKVIKEATGSDGAVAHANIKVDKPEEIGEYATTVVDARQMVPELLAIAAAASKLKLTNVFVTFTKKDDVAHQALVIEYESFVEDKASLNVATLTAPAFHSKEESVWSYGNTEEAEPNVVSVFVEISATCPNQTVELVASVSLPPPTPEITDVTHFSQSHFEPSCVSWSESSSIGLLQAPKFIKTLENVTGVVGEFQQFKCIVSGTPVPTIRWYVDGDIIHDSDVYQTIYEDGVCILKIRELAIEDEGEYTCQATNDAGQTITKCFLQIITESDALKYQQQAMLENIPYSNNGSNSNDPNDNLAYRNNSSFRNVNGNCVAKRSSLIEHCGSDSSNLRKQFAVVSYEFVQIESTSAETAITVTRYAASSEGFHKNLASEERSFSISVCLPNAETECDFIWTLTNCEAITLNLISAFQTVHFVLQKFPSQRQTETAYLLLSMKELTFENTSFAICQPCEEIFLLKKPASAFVSNCEFCTMRKVQLEFFIESSNKESRNKGELAGNIALGAVLDIVDGDDATNLVVQVNPALQMEGENVNNLAKVTSEQNEKVDCYKDEKEEELQIPIISQEVFHKEVKIDLGIASKTDGDKFKSQISGECPRISASSLAAILRYIDELLDFNPDIPIGISTDVNATNQSNVNSLNTTSSETGNDLLKKSANEEYMDCSFCRSSEHVEAIRNLSVVPSASNRMTGNFSSSATAYLNSNPNSQSIVPNKSKIRLAAESLSFDYDYFNECSSGQNVDNSGSKESYRTFDTCNSFSMLEMQSSSHPTAETYPLHFTRLAESTDASATFDASEEFEVFSSPINSKLQHGENSSRGTLANECNITLVKADQLKLCHANSGIVDKSNTRISAKKSSSAYGAAPDDLLSRIREIDEVCKEVEGEIKMKSEGKEEALQIERAIYDISERIEHQQSLTEAQAEASEELLKTILENIIKNTEQSTAIETMAAYKKPVILLRKKLTDLEEILKREDLGFTESSKKSVREAQLKFSKSFSVEEVVEDESVRSIGENSVEREIHGLSLYDLQQIGNVNKQEIKRMTPLTYNIKEQLQSLENMLEEVEKEGDDMKESTAETQATFPTYSDAKQHEVRNILMQINNEISIIKRCCQRNISKASVDTAIGLLHKVRNNISSIIDVISLYRRRLRKKSPVEKGISVSRERIKSTKRARHRLSSPYSKTGFFYKSDASVNVYFVKREEGEIINAIVKLSSSSSKSGNKMSKSRNSEISTYEDAMFDDENNIPQGRGIDPSGTFVFESDKDEKAIVSNFVHSEGSALPPHCAEDLQAAPVRPPRRRREKNEQEARPNNNLVVQSRASDAQHRPLPMLQNMLEMEMSQSDVLAFAADKLASKNFSKIDINCERIIKKVESFCSCSYTWPSKECRTSLEVLDESSSVQLICEDSEYGAEAAVHSLCLFEQTNGTEGKTDGSLLQTLALSSNLDTSKAETTADDTTKLEEIFTDLGDKMGDKSQDNQNNSECLIDMNRKLNESLKTIENRKSSSPEDAEFETFQKLPEHFSVLQGAKTRELPMTNSIEDETNSLHEIESIDELDDLMVICNPHASVTDSIDLLPTAMEDSENENAKFANSFMSISTNTIIAVNISSNEEEESDTASSTSESKSGPIEKAAKVPSNPLKKSDAGQVLEEATVSISYKKPSDKLRVLAVLSPEVQAETHASTIIEKDFDVLIEQPDEEQDFFVRIPDHIGYSASLDLTLGSATEIDLSPKRGEQCEGILSYQAKNLVDGEVDKEQVSTTSEHDDHYHLSHDKERRTGISVNVIARSMHDVARASLEEIPWGEVSMCIIMRPTMARSITDSERRNSLIQNVTVSESNETEKCSLHSRDSFRSSSQKSFDLNEFSYRSNNEQNVPSYVVKEGSTATITCEFNNFLAPGSFIDWFKGKVLMQIVPGKTDRISHDLLEVLLISDVNVTDGDTYSIRVNDVIYPVACLVVESADASSSEKTSDDVHFISPPQTLFVMEGQPSIIACQVSSGGQKIDWYKDNKKLVSENERMRLESDQLGYHRIIIDKSEIEDQGTYYAFLGDHFTTITLVVEERIDEREVTISALGAEDTEDDDYREYLVPLGSTATIACELENSDEVHELMWRKDGARIEFSDDAKVEHVVNGLKHYLVIHDTQADDSASYSICINDVEFKIAHLIVSNCATAMGGKHTKHISRSSLH
ncbi:unnamed protein product [Litomosoides sigmodontis]|uniref:Ig-like domain-containing protein n=1 Tax=Litomosoides sigmodontis TaxID=42156 RepID=A0A3P6U3B7_LITSI|nr:unnamed protein product [Litomosoides sigmodontis]